MVVDPANQSTPIATPYSPHPLLALIDTPLSIKYNANAGIIPTKLDASNTARLTTSSTISLLYCVDISFDNFIVLAKGRPAYRRRVCDHVFYMIEKVFRTNTSFEPTRKEPNSLKKLQKGDVAWISKKCVLEWFINTLSLTISLPT